MSRREEPTRRNSRRAVERTRQEFSQVILPTNDRRTDFSSSAVGNIFSAIRSNQHLMKNGGHVFDMVLRTLGPQYYSLKTVRMIAEWVINNWEMIVEFLLIGLEKAVKYLEKAWFKLSDKYPSFWSWLCKVFKFAKSSAPSIEPHQGHHHHSSRSVMSGHSEVRIQPHQDFYQYGTANA